ncbi:hypothetical protein OC844_004470 [Tilletia horrida]|nr:hypothetical protein OC844_004470 [Tilletia horrida]
MDDSDAAAHLQQDELMSDLGDELAPSEAAAAAAPVEEDAEMDGADGGQGGNAGSTGAVDEDARSQSSGSEWSDPYADEDDDSAYDSDDSDRFNCKHRKLAKPWSESHFSRSGGSAPQDIIDLHDEIAVLTLKCSTTIRDALEGVRWLTTTYTKRKRLLPYLHAFCRRLLRFLFLVAKREAAEGSRDHMGTQKSLYLHMVKAEITCWEKLQATKDYRMCLLDTDAFLDTCNAMIESMQRLKDIVSEAKHQLRLNDKNHRLAAELAQAPRPSSAIFLYFRSQMISATAEADEHGLETQPPIRHLLQLHPIFKGLQWSSPASTSPSTASIEHAHPDPPTSSAQQSAEQQEVPIEQLTMMIEDDDFDMLFFDAAQRYLTDGVLQLTAPRRLALEDHAEAMRWQLRASTSAALAAKFGLLTDHIFRSAERQTLLRGIVIALCTARLYKPAAAVAEVLTVLLREDVERMPSSLQARMRLSYALGLLSWLFLQSLDYFDAMAAAQEAVKLLQPLYDAHPGNRPEWAIPLAQMKMLHFRSLDGVSWDFDGNELDSTINIISDVLKHNSASDDIRLALAIALQQSHRYKHSQTDEEKAAEYQELLHLFRDLSRAQPRLYDAKLAELLQTKRYWDSDSQIQAGYIECLRLRTDLARRFPQTHMCKLAKLYLDLGLFHSERREFPEAMNALQLGINLNVQPAPRIYRRWRFDEDDPSLLNHVPLDLLEARADVFFKMEMYVPAMTDFEVVLARTEASDWKASGLLRLLSFCALMSDNVAKAATYCRSLQKSLEDRAGEWLEQNNVRHDSQYIGVLGLVGAVECANGDVVKALEIGADAVHLSRHWLKVKDYRLDEMRVALGCNLLYYGATLLDAGRAAEAEIRLNECLPHLEGHPDRRVQLKTALVLLARAQGELGHGAEAVSTQARADAMPERGFATRLGRSVGS